MYFNNLREYRPLPLAASDLPSPFQATRLVIHKQYKFKSNLTNKKIHKINEDNFDQNNERNYHQ